ncbi:MAG: hypothetical protein ABIZ80_23865 [Bryobacteraceae bacterium]
MDQYVIAVRRDARGSAPADWSESLKRIPGLEIRGAGNASRVQVEASPEAIASVRKKLGAFCHIEPAIVHKKA